MHMHKKDKTRKFNKCYFWGMKSIGTFCVSAFLHFPTLCNYMINMQSGENVIFINKPINCQSYYCTLLGSQGPQFWQRLRLR